MSKSPIRNSPMLPKVIWVVLFAILAYFLWMEHRAHVIEYLPTILLFAVLLLCPLMHFFMHHGHNHKHKNGDKRDNDE